VLVIDGVKKSFGATRALESASLNVEAGQVHALLGENGAGKSTLMGIVAGLIAPDGGVMKLDGRPYAPKGTPAAREAGVAIVPQEPTLCEHLDVADNVVLGREPTRFGLRDRRAAAKAATEALGRLGLSMDVGALAGSLSPADRQIVAIARALAQATPRVVIVDEPTSSLPHAEAERVLTAVRDLASSGVAVIYVSHHLEEIVKVADHFTVLRDGRTVESSPMKGTSIADLTKLLLGTDAAPPVRSARERGPEVLVLRSLAGSTLPRDASLTLHRGEILGIAGLVGSGRTETLRVAFGLDVRAGGEVRDLSPRGVAMASEDRKREGIVAAMSVADNLTLSHMDPIARWGIVSEARQRSVAAALVERLSIRTAGVDATAASLSGGNQQKVVLGRLIHQDADVLFLDEPTRGVDLKSREQIYALCDDLAARGKAIVWVSSQLGELLRVCDRVAIMRRGVLGPPIEVSELDEHRLLEQMSAA
jgi:ribose transport system ATP-binding protein